jgi:YVTN family beta-propeller protein
MTEHGTELGALVVPLGTFPTHAAEYGRGGFQAVADATARDAIPTLRRSEGMKVRLNSTGVEYVLGSGLTNSDWTAVSSAASSINLGTATITGTLPDANGGQLTGDVTKTAGAAATVIANDAVTNAKAANMAQSTIKGRAAGAGTGDPTDLTATQATAILNAVVGDSGSGGTKGLVPAPGAGDAANAKYLSAYGDFRTVTPSLGSAGRFSLFIRQQTSGFSAATDICYVPSQKKCYVACGASNFVAYQDMRLSGGGSNVALGVSAFSVVYCPSNGYVYAGSSGGQLIKVIDPSSNTVIATISGVTGGCYLGTYDPVSGYLYFTTANNKIVEIDPATNTLLRMSGVIGASSSFGKPTVLNGKIYFAQASGISVVSRSTLTLTTTIAGRTGDNASGSSADTARNLVWVGGLTSTKSVAAIDVTTDTVVATVATSNGPSGVFYDSVSDTVYVNDNSSFTAINASTKEAINTSIQTSGGGAGQVCVDDTLGAVVVAQASSSLVCQYTRAYH